MADPQQKPKGPEVKVPAAPEVAREVAPTIQEKQEKEITQKSGQERSGIALEILEARVLDGSENLTQEIEQIKLEETVETQKNACQSLRVVLKGTLNRLFKATISPKEIKKLTHLPEKVGHQAITFLPVEKAAFQKLQEILNGTGELSTLWKELWPEIVDADYTQYREAKGAQDAIESGKFRDTKGNGIIDSIKAYPFIAAGIAAAGAYAIYKIYKFFTSSAAKPEQEESGDSGGLFSKVKKWLIGSGLAIGGIFTLGQLLGKESLFKFFRDEFKIDINDSRIVQMLIALSHGDPLEALRVLFDGPNEYFHMYEDVISNVKAEQHDRLSHSCLRLMGKKKYKEFIAEETKEGGASTATKDAAKKAAKEMGISETMLEFIGVGEAKEEQQKALKDYLKAHTDKITDPNVTVNGALAQITDNPDIYQQEKVAPADQEPTAGSTAVDVVTEGTDKIVGLGVEIWKDLKEEEMVNKSEFEALFKRIETPFDLLSLTWWKDFVNACAKNSISIVIHSGKVMLWDGYKFVMLTTGVTFVNLIKEVIQAPFSDEHSLKTAAHAYVVASSPFLLYYGTRAGWSLLTESGFAKVTEAAKFAGKGLIAPIEVVRGHVKFGASALRAGQTWRYKATKFLCSKEAIGKVLLEEASFYAEQIEKLQTQLASASQRGRATQWMRERISLYSEDELRSILKRYLSEFIKNRKQAGVTNVTLKDGRVIDLMKIDLNTDAGRQSAQEVAQQFLEENGVHARRLVEGMKGNVKVHDVIEFKDGAAFKVTEVEANGTIKGLYRGAPGASMPADHYRIMEIRDGKVSFKTEAGAAIPGEFEVKTVTSAPAIETAEYYKDPTTGKQKLRVKVHGKPDWIEIEADEKSSKTELIKRLKERLAESGKLTAEEMAQVEGLFAESKLLKYLSVAEKILGPTTAALIMWHLNTAPDKKKALAETAIGLGTFLGGMRATDWAVGNKIGGNTIDPRRIFARVVVDFMGGLALSLGVTEPITTIVDQYILTFPGAYGASDELLSATNKIMGIYGLRTIEKIGIKVAEKTGIQVLERLFIRQVESGILKKISKVMGVSVMKTLIKYIAVKCPLAAVLLADDIGPQGVITWIDDIVAVGLLLWTAKDVYDVVMVIRDAIKVNEEMQRRSQAPIKSFTIPDQSMKATLQEKLIPFGKTVDTMLELGEENMMTILRTIPALEVEIVREGISGSEVWIMKNGEVVGMKIKEGGKVIAEVKDGDAEKIDAALAEAAPEQEAQ